MRTQPFPSWPIPTGREGEWVQRALDSGTWGGTRHGPLVMEFAAQFAAFSGARFGVGVSSCTHGLELGLRAQGIAPGDEVLIPAYTFVATAHAVLAVGAIPVFVDVEPGRWTLSPTAAEAAVSDRTRALIPVHFGGHPADLDALIAVAQKHDLKMVCDCAQSHGALWQGRGIGGWGDCTSFSFNQAKNLTCGEGGLFTCEDEDLYEYVLYSLSTFGRKKDSPWYEHHTFGESFPLTEIQAAILHAQFEQFPAQMERREANAVRLSAGLAEIDGLGPPPMDPRCGRHGWHIFVPIYDPEAWDDVPKQRFVEALNAEGIPINAGYPFPLFDNPMFDQDTGRVAGIHATFRITDCPIAYRACTDNALWLAQELLLGTPGDMEDILAAIRKVREHRGEL